MYHPLVIYKKFTTYLLSLGHMYQGHSHWTGNEDIRRRTGSGRYIHFPVSEPGLWGGTLLNDVASNLRSHCIFSNLTRGHFKINKLFVSPNI